MAILIDTEKYEYKLKWFNSLNFFLKEIIETKKMILIGGDFNIAPFENDIYNFNYFEKKYFVKMKYSYIKILLKLVFMMFFMKKKFS